MRANGCDWDIRVIGYEAVQGGCLEMVEWLRGVNSSEENECLLRTAVKYGEQHIAEWAEKVWSEDRMME